MSRNTPRKALIDQICKDDYSSKPVLLEELRWRVFIEEGEQGKKIKHNLSESDRESFARTLRNHMPGYGIYKLHRPDWLPLGLLARAAIYRLSRLEQLNQVLSDPGTFFVFNLSAKQGKSRITVGCFTYISTNPEDLVAAYKRGNQLINRDYPYFNLTIFPVTAPLSIVSTRQPSNADVKRAGGGSWKVFVMLPEYGFETGGRTLLYEVSPTPPIRKWTTSSPRKRR